MKDIDNNEKEKKNRIVIYIIVLIVILLSLITSCSCTSRFFGKIGDLFRNEGIFVLDNDAGDQEIIRNKDLRFDKDVLEISLSDIKAKLSYTYKNINPDKLTCSTSDADIATCYVQDGFVVINPKKIGTVTITLQTNANGKTYEATATVIITDAKRKIMLANKSGTINLYYTNKKIVAYNLFGISGSVSVTSSDEKIATAKVLDGVIKITAFKKGKAKITVSVVYNGEVYEATYDLTVINQSPTSGSTGGNQSTKPGTSDNTTGGDSESDTRDTNNYLETLAGKKNSSGNKYDLNEEFVKTDSNKVYTINVPYNEKNISLIAKPESEKYSKITYTLINNSNPNGKELSNLDDIPLDSGDNIVKIVVTAENGSTREYTVVIHKPVRTINIDGDIHNINISDGLYTLNYHVYDDDEQNEVNDYKVDDLNLVTDFKGEVKIYKGYITLIPDKEMIDKEATLSLTIRDNNAQDSTKIKVNYDYYLGGPNQIKKYDISYFDADDSSKTIIINTNAFSNEENGVDWKYDKDTKVLTICSKTNKSTCIYVEANGDISSLEYKSGSGEDSLAIVVNGNINDKGEGKGILKVSGTAFDRDIPDAFDIEVSIHQKFNVTISANATKYGDDVFFADVEYDKNGNITKLVKRTEIVNGKNENIKVYEHVITGIGNNIIDLADFAAFRASTTGCEYYKVESFNTKADGTGTTYTISEVISIANKNLVNNLELYAIYAKDPIKIIGSVESEKFEYLTLKDDPEITNIAQHLFYNKDYAKYYGTNANDSYKKVIYPGVSGIYDMYFVNANDTIKTIKGLSLEEIDTICVSEKGVNGCLSMAYSILYNNQAFYGSENRYEILNKGQKGAVQYITLPDIKLDGKKTTSDEIGIQLKWKWVEESEGYNTTDELDTLIGNKSAEASNDKSINDLYKLRVGVKYTTEDTQCK